MNRLVLIPFFMIFLIWSCNSEKVAVNDSKQARLKGDLIIKEAFLQDHIPGLYGTEISTNLTIHFTSPLDNIELTSVVFSDSTYEIKSNSNPLKIYVKGHKDPFKRSDKSSIEKGVKIIYTKKKKTYSQDLEGLKIIQPISLP